MSSSSSQTPLPIASLPVELLSTIFQASNPPPPDADVIEANRVFWDVLYDIQLLRLKHVCRTWKTLVEESPLLWTHISLAFQHPEYISAALQRSKSCLLVVHSAPGYSRGRSSCGGRDRKVASDERQTELLLGLLRTDLHRIRVLAVAHSVQDAIADRLRHEDLSEATALEHFRLPYLPQPLDNSPWFSVLRSALNLRAIRSFGSVNGRGWENFASVRYESLDTLVLGLSDVLRQIIPSMSTMTSILRNLPSLQHLTLVGYDGCHEYHLRAPVELPKLRKLMIVECCHRMAYRLISNIVLPLGCRVVFIGGHGGEFTELDAAWVTESAKRITATVRPDKLDEIRLSGWYNNQLILCTCDYPESLHIPIPDQPDLALRFFEELGGAVVPGLTLATCRHMGGPCEDVERPESALNERELSVLFGGLRGITNLTIKCCFCKAQLPFLMSLIGPSGSDDSILFPELKKLILHIMPGSHSPAGELEASRIAFVEALDATIRKRCASSDASIHELHINGPSEIANFVREKIGDNLEDMVQNLDIVAVG